MYSKAKFLGHPLHPMLAAFPIVFYSTTLGAYLVFSFTGDPFWFRVGITANIAGIVSALIAAVPGFIDWAFGIPKESQAKNTGFWHMLYNLCALAIFSINAAIHIDQWNNPNPIDKGAVVLSLLGFVVTVIAAYLGFTLVQQHHVGVDLTPGQEQLEPPVQRTPGPRKIKVT